MILDFIKRASTISATRFVALSLATIDMIMLGHTNISSVQDYTLASQLIQVFVILAVVLCIGINIVLGQSKDKLCRASQEILGYSICVGATLLTISLPFAGLVDGSRYAIQSYFILAASILPLSIYIGLSNILESQGLEKKILAITIASSVLNVLLNYLAISIFDNAAVAVSSSTLMTRILILIPAIYVGVKYGLIAKPRFSKNMTKKLFSFGRTEALTSMLFTGGISILVIMFSHIYSQEQTAFLGFSLNFMNTFSVIYVGLAISLSISLSKSDKEDVEPYSILSFTIGYILVTALVLAMFTSTIAKIYTPQATDELVTALKLAVAVISIDGIALLFISWLRIKGFSQLPPLFRLSMIFISLPSVFFIQIMGNPIQNAVLFMGIGNLVAAILSIAYFKLKIRRKVNVPLMTN